MCNLCDTTSTNHYRNLILCVTSCKSWPILCYGCRIQLTVSLSRGTNTACRDQNISPLYVLLATPTSNISLEGVSIPILCFNRYFVPNYLLLLTKCYAQHPPICWFIRAYFLTTFSGFGSKDHTKSTFVIPDI